MIALVELVEADGFAACCSLQPDWKRDQPEADVTPPNAGRHVCCSPVTHIRSGREDKQVKKRSENRGGISGY